jgi:hypothetical protein
MKVKIKTWKQMVDEFGLDSDGDILSDIAFTHEIEEMLPEDRIIEIGKDKIWKKEGLFISDDVIEKVIEERKMKKSDLRIGDIIEYRNGWRRFIDYNLSAIIDEDDCDVGTLDDYDENLNCNEGEELDIVAAYRTNLDTLTTELIWSRPKTEEITFEEARERYNIPEHIVLKDK